MTAMVLRTDRSIGLERRPVPTPRGDQVLVDIDLCGICGSDLHAAETSEVYLGGFIMGHEPVGRISRVGSNVIGWHVGQRVCINPNGDTCGICEACRSGRLNHCIPATLERAVGLQADGALAAQVAVSPKTLHAVPDEMGRVESAWVEPAATALRAKFHTGQTLSMSLLLSLLTICFAWRKTSDQREAVLATAGFAVAYWVTQATAILYPDTAFYDPEFITASGCPEPLVLSEAGHFVPEWGEPVARAALCSFGDL